MNPEITIAVTLVLYKIALIAIGLATRSRNRDGEDFFLGGRKLGPVVAAVSASASSSSAWTLLGVSGLAYSQGLSAIWLFPACVGGFLFNWYLLAPALRRSKETANALTLSELVAGSASSRGHRLALRFAGLISFAALTIYVATQFQAAGKTFESIFDLPRLWSVLIGAGIILFYMFFGGFWAVSITDTLQGIVMAISCLVLPIVAVLEIGGIGAFVEALGAVDVPGFRSVFGGATLVGGVGFAIGLLGIGLGYPGQPHVVNRFMALRGGKAELRTARRVAIAWAVVVYAGMLVVGWAGRILFESLGDQETIFIRLTELLPTVLGGVMLAAILSAIMSTADSQLLVAASSVTHDMGIGARGKKNLLWRSRCVVTILCVLATVAALILPESIFENVLSAWTALGAAFGPLLVRVVFFGPVSSIVALLAMGAGFITSVVTRSVPALSAGVISNTTPYIVSSVIVIAGPRLLGRKPGR